MKPTRKERIQAMIDNVQETADFWQEAIDEGTMKGEMLENHSHLVPSQFNHLGICGRQQIFAIEQDFARGGFHQSRHAAYKGGFSAS